MRSRHPIKANRRLIPPGSSITWDTTGFKKGLFEGTTTVIARKNDGPIAGGRIGKPAGGKMPTWIPRG